MSTSTADVLTNPPLFHNWWILMLIIIGLIPLLHFTIHKVYKFFYYKLEITPLLWDAPLLNALVSPAKVFVWVLGITLLIQLFAALIGYTNIIAPSHSIRNLSFAIIVVWFVLRFIKNMENDYTQPNHRKHTRKYDKTTVHAVCQISRILTVLIALLIYLQTIDINISAVLAFGGAGGLIAGLAAKDLLSNFFGGLMIYLDRPFSVGDWIRSPDRDIEGYVEYIGWRLTRIRTPSKRPLYVPNGLFSTISVENPSRMSNRQIKTHIGIRYDDAEKISTIQQEIEKMIREDEDIDLRKSVIVRFDQFSPSALELLIHCFTKTTKRADYMLTQQRIFLKAIAIIEKLGAKCAFPTSTLHIQDILAIRSCNSSVHE